jgi:hypothetical protein
MSNNPCRYFEKHGFCYNTMCKLYHNHMNETLIVEPAEHKLKKGDCVKYGYNYGKCDNDNCNYSHITVVHKNVCDYWYKYGKCKFGSKCNSRHVERMVVQKPEIPLNDLRLFPSLT